MLKTTFPHRRVAVDFDGTLFEESSSIDKSFESKTPLEPIPQASEVTHWLKEQGFEVLIFTCRPDYHRKYLEENLARHRIAYDYILFYTKPRVDLYIDDKGFRFESWLKTKAWIHERLRQSLAQTQEPQHFFESFLRQEKLKFAHLENCKAILDMGGGSGDVWVQGAPTIRSGLTIDLWEPDEKLRAEAVAKQIYRKVFESRDQVRIEEYDRVMVMGVLEHLDDDRRFLEELKSARSLYCTVPNGKSFHRLFGSRLGMLKAYDELQEHDRKVGHRRYYVPETWLQLWREFSQQHSFRVVAKGTSGFKFSSNQEMVDFADRFAALSEAAAEAELVGVDRFFGAELFALLEKS